MQSCCRLDTVLTSAEPCQEPQHNGPNRKTVQTTICNHRLQFRLYTPVLDCVTTAISDTFLCVQIGHGTPHDAPHRPDVAASHHCFFEQVKVVSSVLQHFLIGKQIASSIPFLISQLGTQDLSRCYAVLSGSVQGAAATTDAACRIGTERGDPCVLFLLYKALLKVTMSSLTHRASTALAAKQAPTRPSSRGAATRAMASHDRWEP